MIETEYNVIENEWVATYRPTLQKGYGKTETDAKRNLIWWMGTIGIHPPYFEGSVDDLRIKKYGAK